VSKRFASVAGLGLAALVAAGCGGGGADTTSDGITKAEFIAQANQICTEGDAQIQEQVAAAYSEGKPSKKKDLQVIEDVVIPGIEDQVDNISQLPVPAGEEDAIAAIIDSAERGVQEVAEDPKLLTDGMGGPLLEKAAKTAQDYGLTACGA
jgi:hypothetical protein